MEAPPRGPYVQAALFCERALEEKDGTLSIIRVIDRVTHTVVGPDAPEALPPFSFQLLAVVMLKPGDALGRNSFVFRMERPDGITLEIGNGTVHFEAPDRGVNIRMGPTVQFDQEGLYWFDFVLEGQVLSRMPFRVLYNRVKPGTTQA